jgi:hypothetical protein
VANTFWTENSEFISKPIFFIPTRGKNRAIEYQTLNSGNSGKYSPSNHFKSQLKSVQG